VAVVTRMLVSQEKLTRSR